MTATCDKSGLFTVGQGADKHAPLAQRYNVQVTVRPWTAVLHIDTIHNIPGVNYPDSRDFSLQIGELDGLTGRRAADEIVKLFPQLQEGDY